jgi:hypothetical protein
MTGKANAMTHRSRLQNRLELLGTTAMIAFAIGLAHGSEVLAQVVPGIAFQGTPSVAAGDVSISRGGPSGGASAVDTISVNSSSAIINWDTFDQTSNTPIDFLPQNTVGRFVSFNQNFTVLNRVFTGQTGQPISINGSVISQNFGNATTGNIWFYSPTGIIAGPTSVFNVGSLILTADDIQAANGLPAPGSTIQFRSEGDSTAAVDVRPGAQINLSNPKSYLLLVGPQVIMGGNATINGSAAYIAAEQVDVRINNGAFDIAFITGTDVANALIHSGTTTGPAAANGTIAMAAMPKNTAITMLVGGTVGYTPAATATVQNGTVVLSAGYNITGGVASTALPNQPDSNIIIGNTNFTSSVFGSATSTLTASPTTPGTLAFSSNATLSAGGSVSIGADSGETVTVGGDLVLVTPGTTGTAGTALLFSTATPGSLLAAPSVTIAGATSLFADAQGPASESGQPGIGGTAQVVINGGNLTSTNGLTISAQGTGGDAGGTGGNGTGGTASLTINGGTVTLGAPLIVRADGTGGAGFTASGNGTGGTALVTLNAGATPTVLNLGGFGHQISATGNVSGQFQSSNGGTATGGRAALTINSGTMSAIDLSVLAGANAGDAQEGVAGLASGGTAQVQITGGRLDINTLTVNADEHQGAAGQDGTAGGTIGTGLAAVDVSGSGVLSVGTNGGNAMTISANAIKGVGRAGTPVGGGNLVAGTARLTATNGGTISTDATAPSAPKPPVLLSASVVSPQASLVSPSASQRAGTVIVNADNGTMSLHKLDMQATAIRRTLGSPDDQAGPSFGGTATLAARNGGSITVRTGSGVTPIAVWASGGSTAAPTAGTGGTANILAEGGTLSLADGLTVDATGRGGANQPGTGGVINMLTRAGALGATGTMTVGATILDASGNANASLPNGIGGAVSVTNNGVGQSMTIASLTASSGSPSNANAGSVTIGGDGTTLNITGAAILRAANAVVIKSNGAAGNVSAGSIDASANTIQIDHTGAAIGSNITTLTAPNLLLQALSDLTFTNAGTLRGGTATLVAGRDLGGVGGSVITTGNIVIGVGRNLTLRTLDTNARLLGFTGLPSPPAPPSNTFLTVPGQATISSLVRAGIGNIDLRAGTGISLGDAIATNAGAGINLVTTAGNIGFGALNGPASIGISAPGTITGTSVTTNGNATIGDPAAGGNVTITTLNAGGNALVSGNTANATLAVGTSIVGGFLEARGAAINFGNVTAGTDAILSSFNGGLSVGDVTAGDDIFLTVNGSNATPNTVSPDSQTGVASTTVNALVAGNLRSTGLGSDTAVSGPRTFTGAGPTGNVIRVRASGSIQTGNIVTGGTAIVSSDLAGLTTQAISAPAGVGLFASGNAVTGNVTTAGTFWLGNSTQNFLFVPSYTVSNYPFFQTPTNGGATLGVIQAGLIRGSVLTNTTYNTMTATGDILWNTGNSSVIGGSVTGGALTSGTSMTISAGGAVTFTTANAGTSALLIASTGTVTGTSVSGAADVSISGAAGVTLGSAISTGSNVSVGSSLGDVRVDTANAANALQIFSGGNTTFTTATSGGRSSITAPGAVTGGTLTANDFDVFGIGGVTLTTVRGGGTAASPASTLRSRTGAIRVTEIMSGAPIDANGASIFLRSSGSLNATSLQATAGTIDVASGGNLTVNTARATGDVTLQSGNDLTVTTAMEAGYDFANQNGGGFANAALFGQNVIINGSARAGNALSITATGTATINGNNTAGRSQTDILSSDILIGANGVLGAVGTRLNLSSTAAQMVVGTVAGTGGWRLDAAEISRIVAQSVTISTTDVNGSSNAFNSARAPDILVGSLTVNGGTQIGGEGTFAIQTTGKVRVIGTMAFNGMTRDNTVAIQGFEEIDILDAGRIVLNGQGGLAGTLNLTSRNIVAASSAALTDFTAATDLKAISDRAGKNDGQVDDGGYLQAGGIRATLLNSTLIIQNTGAATTTGNRDYSGRRGFTVGAGGFTIVQGGSNPMRIAINGRLLGDTAPAGTPVTGGFVTGLDVTPLIRFIPFEAAQGAAFTVGTAGLTPAQQVQTARIFDITSTVNGCAIVSSGACRTTVNDPTRDVLGGDFGEGSLANLLPLSIISLKEYTAPGEDPLLDEPVTGAANDDLWSVDDNSKCDPAKEVCK